MKSKLIVATLAVIAIPLTAAIAAKHGGDGQRPSHSRMAKLDTNGDGAISAAEAAAVRSARFQTTDVDGDGQITRAEIETRMLARIQRQIDRRMAHADTDGDGMISQAEAEASAAERFARLDRNGDGQLTGDEMKHRGRHHQHGDRKDRENTTQPE